MGLLGQHGAMPWVARHERRSLLYRYAAPGYVGRPDLNTMAQIEPFFDELSPLGQAICEAPYGQLQRPDIVSLLLEAEAA